ncbi:MAG: type IV pilus assembly protein PilM [Candidatus Pacebacteria bacterium]|nr:type IV pilus assembly protein PilM [Candidatus Paceibacterota bacterium]MDD5721849.1 type IV pilus assembly protein PilM [Candidatus Paceibacterota bacterium]
MRIFKQNLFLGIDIGTTSIKLVELRRKSNRMELANYGILEKYGHLERINDAIQTNSFKLLEESTALLLKQLIEKAKTQNQNAFMTLPSFSGFTSLMELPEMPDKEIAKAVKYQAGQYIPMSLHEMTLDWQIIEREAGKIILLLMAVPTDIIQRYIRSAELAKIRLKGLELENVAVSRLLGKKEKGALALIDIGGRNTSINIVDKGNLRLSRNIDTAGGDFTQVLSSGLGVSPMRAEQLKKASGLNLQAGGEVKVLNLLMPLLDVIKRETEKVIGNYYLRTKKQVEKIILTGGGSNLQGLDEYYSQQMSLPVIKSDPFNLGLISYDPSLLPIIKEIGPCLTSACAVVFKDI